VLLEAGADDFTRKYITSRINEQQIKALNKHILGANRTSDGKLELYTKYSGIPASVIQKYRLSLQEVTERQRSVVLTKENAAKLSRNSAIDSVVRQLSASGVRDVSIFPHDPSYQWNNDFFGTLYIPKAGTTIPLTLKTLPLYKKIIKDYENNTISVTGNQISLNGQVTDSYTFQYDYYWMMGDNRHRSEDSRAWGFVPANHIVGKPIFIWMSLEGINDGVANWKPRWNRVFTTVSGSGEPQSLFKYFLLLLAGWFVFDYFRKRRKKAKQ